MTVQTTSRLAGPFTGTGANATLAFTFKCFDAAELLVTRDAAPLSLNVDYTVTLNADQEAGPGGSVLIVAAANTLNSEVVVAGNTAVKQATSLPSQASWSPKIIEQAFDRLVMIAQEMRALVTGGDSSLRVDLLSTIGASLVSFIASGTGAVARTTQTKLRETVSVKDFGAIGDGVADDTAAVQAALNSGAGRVRLTKGTYLVSAVTVPFDVDLVGVGTGSVLKPADNTSVLLTLSGRNAVRDFAITPASQRTGGTYIKTSGGDVHISHVKFSNGYKLIDISGPVSNVVCEHLYFNQNNNAGASELVTINTTGSGAIFNKILADNNVGSMPLAGIRIRACLDVTITECNLIHCGSDLLIDPPAASVVASVYAADSFFDTATKGISIKPSGGSVVRCHFMNVWASSHTSHGIEIDGSAGTVNGVYFSDPQTNLCGGDGIHLVGGQNVRFSGGEAAQNIGSGFSASATATKFSVRGLIAGATDNLTGNAYGINIAAGASDFLAADNICTGNTTADAAGITPTIASAATIAIPSAGNNFAISGTTGIGTISGGRDGRQVTLQFAGIVVVTNATGTANSVRLASGANFTSAAGSTLTLRHNGTQWYEVARAA